MRIASVIGHHVREGEGIIPVIVVSELSGVTDQLLRIARFACTCDLVSWQQELEALKRKHMEAAKEDISFILLITTKQYVEDMKNC